VCYQAQYHVEEYKMLHLQLSHPLNDQQVSQAWEWLIWAMDQPPHKRVPPEPFQKLEPTDWLQLLEELHATYQELRQHPIH
jgi:hypothetical protein